MARTKNPLTTARKDLQSYMQVDLGAALSELFAEQGVGTGVFGKFKLDNGNSVRIDIQPDSVHLSCGHFDIGGDMDAQFKVKSARYTDDLGSSQDYASVLGALRDGALKDITFRKAKTTGYDPKHKGISGDIVPEQFDSI
tara:strand:- start:1652 stop:2071 length:420 start_codon:yes stop_codon:yes gene_type:complete